MSIMNSRKSTPTKKLVSAKKRTLTRSKAKMQAHFLKAKYVPAGNYRATIVAVTDSKTQGGEEALDVTYELCDPNGRMFKAKERMVIDSYAYDVLVDHFIDAGLVDDGAEVGVLVGICEEVTIEYPEQGGFGRFTDRQPCKQSTSTPNQVKKQAPLNEELADDEDDDYDDLLADEDD